MALQGSTGQQTFRESVGEFLAKNLPEGWSGIGRFSRPEADLFTSQWRQKLRESGLLALTWPEEYGGQGLGPAEQIIAIEEFERARAPRGGPNDPFGIQMLGNTLLSRGTAEQCRYFLPRILSGEDRWCQGYSEPDAGSDLANVRTSAVLDGDEWIIQGRKLWTSAGHLANWIFVLARTESDVPRHKGLSFLLVPLDQPGVEVRPIRMMTGESEFNEVYFVDARTSKEHIIGRPGEGWSIAMALLEFERGEAATTVAIRFKMELERLLDLAKETRASEIPHIRQKLARCFCKVEIMSHLGLRAKNYVARGSTPGPESSVYKLYWSEYHREVSDLAIEVLGADALVPKGRKPLTSFRTDDPGAPNSSMSWVMTFLNARAGTIYAGTSEIQKNILGEMILGLGKDLRG